MRKEKHVISLWSRASHAVDVASDAVLSVQVQIQIGQDGRPTGEALVSADIQSQAY